MRLHDTTFGYLNPTEKQKEQMAAARAGAYVYADLLQTLLPEGPDKTYVLRKLREVAMWANVSLTRNPDGSPRDVESN